MYMYLRRVGCGTVHVPLKGAFFPFDLFNVKSKKIS